eukprot:TRINITY_DN27_c0_g1_i1.p1 TRINITY_DN27_c0_g1~~TRINITY_DN27_c0_g1_i1.p1  ORF type:complete len:903 (-),score=245.01 TRINITY_DN27_c0_g1_i1:190-2898(-)
MSTSQQASRGRDIQEFVDDLKNPDKNVQKEGVKRVIAAMTLGKDVSSLFPHVIKCVNTSNLELKKLVYLYIMNYAKMKPELAVLAVNTFVRDAQDPNPLIRALAVRTMGCIRVENITEYLAEPLRRAIKDEDPYVRKTAAIAVTKLHDIDPEIVVDQGFVDALMELLTDSNPTVVSNAVASLGEISSKGTVPFRITEDICHKLLSAVNECTEWGQVFILDSLVMYETRSGEESKEICERVAPRLQHANPAVVLSAVKVILKFVDRTDSEDFQRVMFRKMAPPLVTLLSSEPEIQYVALRNINLVIQKWPSILRHEIKVFFCKYNDPIYVKMEKVETMIQLADESNIGQVLLEFNEYASEVDVEFVRRSVRAIGRCAIKLERAAQKCVDVLIELIKTRVNYVVQEAIVVIRDIFRRYPNKYESIISVLCENLDSLDEAEAKGAMIWIIGEYAPRIENAGDLLEQFVDGFVDEQPTVQLQLLTSVVKLFLHRPDETQEMVHRVLQLCTEESDNPDLRDRAFVYWRLLSTDPDAAKGVVLAEKPVISDTSVMLEKSLLNRLLGNVSMLSSVYHKPPEEFVPDFHVFHHGDEEDDSDEDEVEDSGYPDEGSSSGKKPIDGGKGEDSSSSDILDLGGEPSTPVKTTHAEAEKVTSSGGIDIDDLLGFSSPTAVGSMASKTPMDVWLPGERGRGLEIRGAFVHKAIEFEFRNTADVSLLGFAIQFNKNMYGVVPAQPLRVPEPLMSGQRVSVTLPITALAPMVVPTAKTTDLQVAVKNNLGVQMFQCAFSPSCLLEKDGKVEGAEFIGLWGSLSDDFQAIGPLSLAADTDADYIKAVCGEKNLAFITERKIEGKRALFFSGKTPIDGDVLLVQLSLCDKDGSRVISRCHTIGYAKGMCDELKRYFVEK